jgi:phosphoribosylanthranilate isomerase
MFRIKICGVTNLADAQLAAHAGADAIGLNFYPASPRACTLEVARQIVQFLPGTVRKVGVFVNAPASEVRATALTLGLDMVQLHGDEPPETLRELKGLAVVRAFRPGGDYTRVRDYLRQCHTMTCMPRMLLIDALAEGAFGGTGKTADWQTLIRERAALMGQPLVLAGGLTPTNVASAIAQVRPWAVDVASGVEESPGRKSAQLVTDFVREAKAALSSRGRAGINYPL